uniref:Uncharacterized protein n=1 Tax=Tetranychus urticae TaxID=32264 RepID=T1JTS9_TETUR
MYIDKKCLIKGAMLIQEWSQYVGD